MPILPFGLTSAVPHGRRAVPEQAVESFDVIAGQGALIGFEGRHEFRQDVWNIDLEHDLSQPATRWKFSHSVGSCFNAAGHPPGLLPSAGLIRRPQNANSAPLAANGNGESE
jgi:hypothetical protein